MTARLPDTFAARITEVGWAAIPSLIPNDVLAALAIDLTPAETAGRGGLRNLLDRPLVQALARSEPVRPVVEAVLGPGAVAVRGLFFDKSAGANWKVPWHQDLTVAVAERVEGMALGPWSVKVGVPHVEAPVELLEQMLAVRVHLDDCGPDNGPIRFLPGSHTAGKLNAARIDEWRAGVSPAEAVCARGGLIAFRPLLLHASSAAALPGHRRVVHLEFAAGLLPAGLRWRWAV